MDESPGNSSTCTPASVAVSNGRVKGAKKKRYNWPPPPDPNDVYVPKERNPIHSILTALPILMLAAGLYIYYKKESEQTYNAPIRAESVEASGIFTGLSEVKSGSQGRHYLWFEDNGHTRGVRIRSTQADQLQVLVRNKAINLKIAPTVHESKTYWAWYIEQSGMVLLNVEESLR